MRSVTTTLAVIEAVGELQPVGVSDVARRAGVPKTTAHRVLQALGELGWIRSTDEVQVRWTLSNKVLTLAAQFANGSDVLELALPAMRELHRRTGETIHLTVPEKTQVVLLHKIESTKPVRTYSWVGGAAPIHATSSGKAILARLPEAEVRALFADGLDRFTERTITDLQELLDDLAEIRERGYALNTSEWRNDVAATAAVILDPADRPVAALSISMPLHRFPRELWEEYGELVRTAAVVATGKPWPAEVSNG
ncbi:IclR family transcriptional regulator [Pseudonocardia nigra]|uniref:IclR family transcriptional regulator n=1 Tax=Pseudonocardia nigra TaxID=1921578 RepID=UPI001C606B85|nr:IclR family transcriptional regulator [Pseudonocardia nigra]